MFCYQFIAQIELIKVNNTSSALFLLSVLTTPARQQWLTALIIIVLFDFCFELGFTYSLGPVYSSDGASKVGLDDALLRLLKLPAVRYRVIK